MAEDVEPREVFFGTRLRVVLTAIGLLVAAIGGAFTVGVLGAPTVVGVENRFGAVSNETTVVETDLVVHNPNPFGVRLGDTTVDYTVFMNEVAMASGAKEGLQVTTGNTTLQFQTQMRNDRIPPWWASHVRNDERTNVTIDAHIRSGILGGRTFHPKINRTVETNIASTFDSNETKPVNSPRRFPALFENPVLYVNRTRGEWGTVPPDNSTTPVNMDLTVFNPQQAKPYTITQVGYEVTMNDVLVGEGRTSEEYVIPGRESRVVETTPTIQNRHLDDWWVSHLRNGQVTELRIDFYVVVELPAPVEEDVRVPLRELTIERTIETDIFGTKGQSGGGPGGGSGSATPTPTPGDGATPTASPGGPTPTPTATPTQTPTPTDGGLLGALAPLGYDTAWPATEFSRSGRYRRSHDAE